MPNRPKKNRDRDVLDQRLMREVERLEVALTSQRTAYLAKIEQLSSEVAALNAREAGEGPKLWRSRYVFIEALATEPT